MFRQTDRNLAMTVLPIVARELRVAARRPGVYRARGGLALAAVGVFVFALLVLARDGVPSSQHGVWIFRTLLTISFVFCLFAGAGLTADSLSEEKREGTLGLLFLTDLKGFDVVLGKLAANSLNALYGLVATLPVHVLSVQLGGVTASDLIRSAVLLLNTLFFSLVVGLLVSAISRDERKAMFATILFVSLAVMAPVVAGFLLTGLADGSVMERVVLGVVSFSPAYGVGHLLLGNTPRLGPPGWLFWSSVAWVHLVTWGLLAFACLRLPWVWQARERTTGAANFEERLEQRLYGEGAKRRRFRQRLLDLNPFLWLAQRERGKPLYVWLYLGAVGSTWLWGRTTQGDVMLDANTVVPTLLLVQGFFKVWVVSEACARLAHDRGNGALELLLSTPLTPAEVLRGQWLALRRQFLRPLLVFALLEFLLLRGAFASDLALMSVATLIADFVALGWMGMWLGLSARNLTRALLGTVFLVLVLPWLMIFTANSLVGYLDYLEVTRRLSSSLQTPAARQLVWFGVGILNSAFWGWLWARRRLRRDFRLVAMRRYQPPPESWWRRWFGGTRTGPPPHPA
jgi:ABC-type transport system involved in multi-copper enzyme maturation permease subunit